MGLALQFAEKAKSLDIVSFDREAVRWAKDAIADMIGCTLLGAPTDTARAALESDMDNPGPCLLLGTRHRVGLLEAAFVNGAAGHALDYDDTSKSLSGHPTVIIVPGLLALAEASDAGGADIVNAYIVGVELATRFARGVNFHHYEKGWHPTATLGIFGAAAAAAHLMRLDVGRTANAIAMAASFASGTKANFGTPTKPLHAAMAARNGLYAALLAEEGVEASPVAFEHPQGYLEVFNGAGNYHVDRMLDGWGEPLDLLNPGISIKKYPCVYSVHGAIDAAIEISGTDNPAPAAIRSVTVRMHRRRMLPHVQNPATSALDAKFSLPYAVARALVTGSVRLEHFEEDALHDPTIMRVMGLVTMDPHEDEANDYGAEVTVLLADGSTLRAKVSAPLGRGPETPLPPGMLRKKFLDCAARSLSVEGASQVFDQLMRLDELDSVRELTARLETSVHQSS